MKMRAAFAFPVVLLLATAAAAQGPPTPTAHPDEPYAAALAALGLEPRELRLDVDLLAGIGQDRFKIPLADYLTKDARRIPGVVESIREHALEAAATPSELVVFGGTRIGARVRRSLIDDPLAELARRAAAPEGLADAVLTFRRAAGGPEPKAEEVFAVRRDAAVVPREVAEAVALVVLAEARFLVWRERAFEKVPARDQDSLFMLSGFIVPQGERPEGANVWPVLEAAADKVEWVALAAGASDVGLAVERALPALKRPVSEGFRFAADTPIGRIEIDGTPTGASRTADAPSVLIVDLLGNDHYASAAAARGRPAPVSVLIDVAGDDVYDAVDPGLGHTFGAGILGLGLLVDVAGRDRYHAGPFTLGAAFFGIGILCDLAGDDVYEGESYTEGAAMFGIGIASDVEGDDSYYALDRAQGFGGVFGAGALIDRAGNDRYVAEDKQIRRPAPQTPDHNASLAQGAASGQRADFTDGRSYAGGFGALIDGAGNDTYAAGVFAQGCGYWFGVGILADKSGDDRYDAVWYAQGAGAHFAVGALHDAAGADVYHASMNAAMGCGHDYSIGFLYEGAGDDTYEAPNLSLGAAAASGLGILVERAGNDRYKTPPGNEFCLGRAVTQPNKPYDLRKWGRTLGVFLDLGGADTYVAPFAANGRTWPRLDAEVPDDLNARGAVGVGVDR